VLGGRKVAVVREISKKFEEMRSALPQDLIAHYAAEGAPKGEIVLVIEPPVAQEVNHADVEAMLKEALQDLGTKEAAAQVAAKTGMKRKALYDLAIKITK